MKSGKNTKQNIGLAGVAPTNPAPSGNGEESISSMITQDFRPRLAGIGNCCRAILESHNGTLDDESKEHLLKIYDETRKMNRLIDILLHSPRKAQRRTRAEKVDLGDMAKAITEGLMLTKPERRVKFIVALDVMAGGDAGLLRIAMKNLLNNAWKYTAHKEEALIEFGVTECGGETAYFVRDNGVGFDLSKVDKLFAPLGANKEIEGAGVGLDTVKKIIERHKGKVWAEGKIGTGATFYFTLG